LLPVLEGYDLLLLQEGVPEGACAFELEVLLGREGRGQVLLARFLLREQAQLLVEFGHQTAAEEGLMLLVGRGGALEEVGGE
jgi:hypothetical protein